MMKKVGEKIHSRELRTLYEYTWRDWELLQNLEALGRGFWMIKKELPNPEDHRKKIHEKYTHSMATMLEEVQGEVESLKEELEEWLSNLPENLQDSYKASELQEAIDTLESFPEFDIPSWADTLLDYFPPSYELDSRGARAGHAAGILETIQENIETIPDPEEGYNEENVPDISEQEKAFLNLVEEEGGKEDLLSQISEAIDVLQSVSFPSMM